MAFAQDAQHSCRAFEKFVEPVLRHALKATRIMPTESKDGEYDSELAAALDRFASVDGMIITATDEIFFYASRVQFGQNYATFTIRRSRPTGTKTEFDKLIHARQVQAPMPTFHVQTYVDANGQGAVVAVVETLELMRYVYKHRDQWRKTDSGESFYYAGFADVAAQIYHVDAAGVVKDVTKSVA